MPPPEAPKPPPAKPVAKAKPPKAKKEAAAKAPKSAAAPRKKRAPAVGRLPRLSSDPVPALIGDKDLVYEIPESDLRYHTGGPEAGWLPLSQMPKELRPDGFVYLQIDRELVARASVTRIGFRERRWGHGPPDVAGELGPGATLELRPWTSVSIDLGPEGDIPVTGFRYVVEQPNGTVIVAPREPTP